MFLTRKTTFSLQPLKEQTNPANCTNLILDNLSCQDKLRVVITSISVHYTVEISHMFAFSINVVYPYAYFVWVEEVDEVHWFQQSRPMGQPVPFHLSQQIIPSVYLPPQLPSSPPSIPRSILRNAISERMKGQCFVWFNQYWIELDQMRVHYLKALFVCWRNEGPVPSDVLTSS